MSTTYDERYLAIVKSFHTLEHAPGVTDRGVDLHKLDAWAAEPMCSSGARAAAQFVLHLWHSREEWRSGPFNLFSAIGTWDDGQLDAWKKWAAAPWRP
jgi:hypothetical protein